MKELFIVIILLTLSMTICFGQEWDDTCEEAIARAENDFKNGIMKATTYGLVVAEDYYFEEFYDKYLKDNYGVESSNGGCVITESLECYSSRIFELIEAKYGSDFFKKTRKEAKRLYKPKQEQFMESHPTFNNDGIYVVVDTMPEYPGGYEELFKFVEEEIQNHPIASDSLVTRTYVSMVIDSTGQPTNIEVLKGSDNELNEVLVDILQKMSSWKPGKLKGENVSVKLVLPFSYKSE